MANLDAYNFLKKYETDECTPEEIAIIEDSYIEFKITPEDVFEPMPDFDEVRQKLKKNAHKSKRINWPLNILLTAAAIAIVGSFTVLFNKRLETLPMRYATDINPGGNKATLTLQNGKKIQLSDAKTGIVINASKLTYNDGTLINNEQVQTFSISTPRGGSYQVQLPDGSNVWLNAASSLTYNHNLKGQEQTRNVTLSGEAYFEVTKDKKHPFIVTTDKQKIEVLGTHFNISAYIDDLSAKTTLLEGSVKVAPLTTTGNETKGIILKPNQQSETTSNGISIHEVYIDDVIAWKNGDFTFTSESLKSIMQRISRWYNIDIEYIDHKIGTKTFSGTISKFEKVSQVLCLLEATGEVKFKIDGRRITVMK